MITEIFDPRLIPIRGISKSGIEKLLTNIKLDYFEIDPRRSTQKFYNRKNQRQNPEREILDRSQNDNNKEQTDINASENKFVPIENFARKVSAESCEMSAEKEEEELNSLLLAFARIKVREAYEHMKFKYEAKMVSDFT